MEIPSDFTKVGLFQKYEIRYADGTPVNPKTFYFVLNITNDENAREALRLYGELVEQTNPILSIDIDAKLREIEEIGFLAEEERRLFETIINIENMRLSDLYKIMEIVLPYHKSAQLKELLNDKYAANID